MTEKNISVSIKLHALIKAKAKKAGMTMRTYLERLVAQA